MIFKKILTFLKLITKAKYVFREPLKKDLLIFDGESIEELKYILSSFKYEVLETRVYRIKTIYITPKIIYLTFINNNKDLFNSYLLTILDLVRPKVVFTFIDNSFKFSKFASLRQKKYKFLALQNGARYEHKIFTELFKKRIINKKFNFFIPYFLCFGKNEIEDFKKYKQKINDFSKVGSLKVSNFILAQKNKKISNLKPKNDILLISDIYCWDSIIEKLNFPLEESVAKLIKFAIKYSRENNKKFKLATRNTKDSFKKENNFYKKNLNREEYNYLKKNIFFRKGPYDTYKQMLNSKIVIGTMSTMLRENLSLGGKSLSCNFTKTNIFDFPINGICNLKNCEYSVFYQRLKKILSISHKNYLSRLSKDVPYLVFKDKNKSTIDLVKSQLNFHLN
jgi:surface carbohydrate biosynthesis protein